MRAIEHARVSVVKSSEEKAQPDGPEADIRQGDDHRSALLQQRRIFPQHTDRPGKVLEDVGEDDGVELAPAERGRLQQIGLDHFADPRARDADRLRAGFDPGHAVAELLDVL